LFNLKSTLFYFSNCPYAVQNKLPAAGLLSVVFQIDDAGEKVTSFREQSAHSGVNQISI